MVRILLFLCCVLIGMDFIESYGELEAYSENLGWLPLVQRIAVCVTALVIIAIEYSKIRSFNITILVFALVAIIFNPFKHLEVSTISKIAVIVLFFIQAIKDKSLIRFKK